MTVKNLATLLNLIATEVLGQKEVEQNGQMVKVDQDIAKEDLSNFAQTAQTFSNAIGYDNYVRKLVDHIGKMVFVDRAYQGRAPKVLMDGWEYGSIVEKVDVDLPETKKDDAWDLQDGQTYSQDVFHKPNIRVTFYNGSNAYKVELSITNDQIKSSLNSPTELNRFVSTIYTKMQNKMTLNYDELVMRTINNFIGETIFDEYKTSDSTPVLGDIGAKSGVRAVNLLYLYNTQFGLTGNDALTADKALVTPSFLMFATAEIKKKMKFMETYTTLYNLKRAERFTPRDKMHVVFLSDFTAKCDSYLRSPTFHDELVKLPEYEEVAYWQALGSDETADGELIIKTSTTKKDVTVSGKILGVVFDHEALGVRQPEAETRMHMNEMNKFWNVAYCAKASYFNADDENFVVFFIQDPVPANNSNANS